MSRKSVAPKRREQIVEALFQCLADNGHETVTVKDIAERANLHYGVIHYYFKSKDDIVSAMADSIIARYEKLLLERIRSIPSARERIEVSLDFRHILAFFRSVLYLGIIGKERVHYWRLLFWTQFRRPRLLPLAITLAIYGHHFRKVYEQHVLQDSAVAVT